MRGLILSAINTICVASILVIGNFDHWYETLTVVLVCIVLNISGYAEGWFKGYDRGAEK